MSLFIAVDGPNGAGKTTLVEAVVKKIKERKIEIVQTREPTDTELGRFVRGISEFVAKESLACLVSADRYEHLNNLILPSLEAGKIVICERYLASSLVFQRMDGVETEYILSVNGKIKKPDIYFILNAPAEVLYDRLHERSELTRFEKTLENQKKEEKYYRECIKLLEELDIQVYTVDMTMKIENCIEFVVDKIIDMLGEH